MACRSLGTALLLALLFLVIAIPVARAQGVGAIGGNLSDASGAVLPGVTVTLSSPDATVGSNQTTVSNERGAYQFTRLVPGRYTVTAELQGFRRASQEDVIVNADVTARVDLKLEIGQVEEGILVKGEGPLLDTTSALKQTVVSSDLLQQLPNRVDLWGIVKSVPSVTLNKVDVGGNESFLQSTATIHGTANENGYMMDGMDLTFANGPQTILYPDPFIFQEINYQLGGGSAELSQGGVVFNQVTKSGTNVFHGGFTFAGANNSMSTNNVTDPALRTQLLLGVPAKALAANPNIVPGSNINHIYDTGGWAGGPIKRDKLWFMGAAHTQVLNRYVLGSYNSDGSQVVDDNKMWNLATKLSWQMTASSQLSYFYNLEYKLIRYRNDDVSVLTDTRARNLNDKYPYVHQLKWTKSVGSHLVLDASGSYFFTKCDCSSPQPEVQNGDIARFDSVTNTITVARPFYGGSEYNRNVALASVSYYAGDHQIKVGYSYNTAYTKSENYSINNAMRAVFRNRVPDSVNTYNVPSGFQLHTRDQAVYVQDRWLPFKKLTLNLGLRFEALYGWEPAPCQPDGPWVTARCFPDLNGVPDFKNAAPRFSLIYDLFGDGKTALKISANRYNVGVGTALLTQINPIRVTNDTRSWVDANHDGIPQLNELGPSTGFNLGTTNRFNPDLKRPISNEYAIELQHQLPGNIVVSAAYMHRDTRNNIGAKNVAVSRDTYIPIDIIERTSGRDVIVYNQDPTLRGRFDVLYDNYTDLDTTFNGVDLTVQKRLSNHWMLSGGASFGRSIGDQYCGAAFTYACSADLNNPNLTFLRGLFGLDTPYAYRATGIYELPYAITLSGTAQRNAGFPELTTVLVGPNSVALTQVMQTLVVEPRGTTRLPPLSTFDLSLTRTWRYGKVAISPRLDAYNVFNAATILGRNTQLGPAYGVVNSIEPGRLIKLGMNLVF
jgi:hypothetical protein